MDNNNIITRYLESVQATISALPQDDIRRIVEILRKARTEKRRVYIFGNGGSAATASHFACDLNKGANSAGKPRLRAIALTDSLPLMTAWANDSAYADIFREQLENHLEPGDIVIGISGSGNSMNVVNGLQTAKSKGATTVALTGFDGGKVKDIAHYCVVVPSNSMEQIEDIHLVLEHLITTCLREG